MDIRVNCVNENLQLFVIFNKNANSVKEKL